MSARPDTWMPLYWGDYSRDTGHLNAAGHGAYLMLIKHYWCSGGPVADDDDELWRVACCDSKKEWLKLRAKVVRFFRPDGGLLRHKRIDIELQRAEERVAAKAEAGRKGAERRWQSHNRGMAMPLADDGCAIADLTDSHDFANAHLQSHTQKKEEDTPLPPKGEAADGQFEVFWAAYPHKRSKGHARKAFTKAIKLTSLGDMLEAIKRQTHYWQREPDKQPHPATWLNGERWLESGGPANGSGTPMPIPGIF